MGSYPLVQEREFSFASITLKVDGNEYLGADAINYDDGLTPSRTYGTRSVAPQGATAGQWEGSGNITFKLADARALRDALGTGWGLVAVTITVQFSEDGADAVHTHTIVARLVKVSMSNSAGSDATKETFDLFVLQPIDRDGKTIVPAIPASGAAAAA